MSRKAIWIVGGVVAALALCAVACSILWLLTGIPGAIAATRRGVEDVEIQVDAPDVVDEGEQTSIVVQITNTASEAQRLYSIQVFESYLKGIAITSARPAYVEHSKVPLVDVRVYRFEHSIPPGETTVVVLNAVAVQEGPYLGTLSVCINRGAACESFEVWTMVE
jgi:hypothetical protein